MADPAFKRAPTQYQRETLGAMRELGVELLLTEHWLEISHYPDILLEVDWPAYEAAEANGKFRVFTARIDGVIVGYATFFVNRNPHYKSSLQAVQDILFLSPPYRGSTLGYRLIAFAHKALKAEGCQCEYHHQKIAHPALGRLLKKMGYEPIEIIWAKRLDRET
jgi:GNAT superfamily N-acetyltransferase